MYCGTSKGMVFNRDRVREGTVFRKRHGKALFNTNKSGGYCHHFGLTLAMVASVLANHHCNQYSSFRAEGKATVEHCSVMDYTG